MFCILHRTIFDNYTQKRENQKGGIYKWDLVIELGKPRARPWI